MTKKENFIVKEKPTISEDMKQIIIDYISCSSIRMDQFTVGDEIYQMFYTITCPAPNGTVLFKNNQFVEPFNQYYQKLLTASQMITDLNGFFLSQKIEDFHLDPEQMKYLKLNYPRIITVQDFIKSKPQLIDPYMEHIRNTLMCFEAITSLVVTKNKANLNTNERKGGLARLEVEEKDCQMAQEFVECSSLSMEEMKKQYKLVQSIDQSIDFYNLRKLFYQRLKKVGEDKYPNLIMELNDEKDDIYKYVTISIENMTVSMEQCKELKKGYFIYERIEVWNEYETYFTRKLLKTNPLKQDDVIALVYKEWRYNDVEQSLEEMPALDFTTDMSNEEKEYLEITPSEQKHYLRCLSKNKK